EESVAILRETAGTSVDLACALVGLGQSRLVAGELVGAARELAEALSVARASRPRYWITYALYWQGCVAQASGDLAAARGAFDEGVALALEDGYNAPIAHLATMRGRLALAEGDTAGALASFAIGLASPKRTKNPWSSPRPWWGSRRRRRARPGRRSCGSAPWARSRSRWTASASSPRHGGEATPNRASYCSTSFVTPRVARASRPGSRCGATPRPPS